MLKPNRYNPTLKNFTHLFCCIIGVTFFISGGAKALDPWGTAIKFNEYFVAYGLTALLPLSKALAIWLCGAEMMMGCMIFCRVRLRLISIFALISMSIFTIVTILNLTVFPVEDCGCFGDVLYLSTWQTLIKNLILLPMVITIWWRYRPDKILVYKRRELILATIFCTATMGFSAYNYFHLPLIDFMPYKVGVDLLAQTQSTTSDVEYSMVLIYRNIESGKLYEFSVDDTEWHDEQRWEWVETRTEVASSRGIRASASDFALSDFGGEWITADLLGGEEQLNLIAITDLDKISPRCLQRIANYIERGAANGERTVVITPQRLTSPFVELGDHTLEGYNIDATTLKTMMRASVGVVELKGGVILSKRSCIDL